MINKHETKDLEYWTKQIKKNPKNKEVLHYWLKALINEGFGTGTKEEG